MEQEIHGTDITVLEAVLVCDEERSRLLEEEKELLAAGVDTVRAHILVLHTMQTIVCCDTHIAIWWCAVCFAAVVMLVTSKTFVCSIDWPNGSCVGRV